MMIGAAGLTQIMRFYHAQALTGSASGEKAQSVSIFMPVWSDLFAKSAAWLIYMKIVQLVLQKG